MNLYGTLFSMELNHVFLLEHKNTEQHADTKLKTQKEPHGPPIYLLRCGRYYHITKSLE
jgi:hypothetical protein